MNALSTVSTLNALSIGKTAKIPGSSLAIQNEWKCHARCGCSQHSTSKPEWNQISSLTSEFFSNMVLVLREIKIVGWFRIQFASSLWEEPCYCSHTVLRSIPPNDGPISRAVAMVWIYTCVLRPVVAHSVDHTHCTCTSHARSAICLVSYTYRWARPWPYLG